MATHSLNQNLWRMPRHERLLRLVGEKLAEGARVHYWIAGVCAAAAGLAVAASRIASSARPTFWR